MLVHPAGIAPALAVFQAAAQLLRYRWWLRRKESNLRIPVSEAGVCTDTNYSALGWGKWGHIPTSSLGGHMAPRPGLEPGTVALTARYSTIELPRIGTQKHRSGLLSQQARYGGTVPRGG